jgi:hypothetical protein
MPFMKFEASKQATFSEILCKGHNPAKLQILQEAVSPGEITLTPPPNQHRTGISDKWQFGRFGSLDT